MVSEVRVQDTEKADLKLSKALPSQSQYLRETSSSRVSPDSATNWGPGEFKFLSLWGRISHSNHHGEERGNKEASENLHTDTHTHLHTYTCTHTHTHTYTYTYTLIHTHTYTHIHTHTHQISEMFAHLHTHTWIHIYIHTYTHIHTHTHTYTHTPQQISEIFISNKRGCSSTQHTEV